MKSHLALWFSIGVLFLWIQIGHHSYYTWFEPRKSVLDKYVEKKEVSVEELARLYDEAYRKVKALEADKVIDEDDFKRLRTEPYKSEIQLRADIEEKELTAITIFRDRSMWLYGLAGTIIGLILFRWVHELLGLPIMIAAFMEMIVATHDLSVFYKAGRDAIILNKLILATITLAILIGMAYIAGVFHREEDPSADESAGNG